MNLSKEAWLLGQGGVEGAQHARLSVLGVAVELRQGACQTLNKASNCFV